MAAMASPTFNYLIFRAEYPCITEAEPVSAPMLSGKPAAAKRIPSHNKIAAMRKSYTSLLFLTLLVTTAGYGQQSTGIGTTTPDNNAVLDIHSTTAGVLIPRLSAAQQTTLAGMLT